MLFLVDIKTGVKVVPCAVWAEAALAGIKLAGIQQPKPMDYRQIFRIGCIPTGCRAD